MTATDSPLRDPFLILAAQVYPKCPLPTSSPISYLAAKPLLNPNPLSRPLPPSPSPPPSSGIAGRDGPCRRASAWRMCLAGDGGGKGSRRRRLAGVVLAEPAGAGDLEGVVAPLVVLGEAAAVEEKRWCAGLGLGVEKGKKGEDVQCFLEDGVDGPGGGVAGAAGGGEPSASCVSGFAWQPPIAGPGADGATTSPRRARDLDRAGACVLGGGGRGHGGGRVGGERVVWSGDWRSVVN